MLSPSRWRRRLTASALAQCFGVFIHVSTMFKFSKVCVWRAVLSSDNSCYVMLLGRDISVRPHSRSEH